MATAVLVAAAASGPCPAPSSAAIRTPSAPGWTTYASPDSRSFGNGDCAAPHTTASPVIPFLHRDRGALPDLGCNLEFVHQPPRAWQANSQAFARRVAISHHGGDIWNARSLVGRDDLDAFLVRIVDEREDDFAFLRVFDDVPGHFGDVGSNDRQVAA